MGARGNSGVIASQIFRGMAEALGGKHRFNGPDLAHALTQGTATAYKAVVKPVEGTILTVIREASAAAVVVGGGRAATSRTSWPPRSRVPPRPWRRRRRCCRSCATPASSMPAGRVSTGCCRARCSTWSSRTPAAAPAPSRGPCRRGPRRRRPAGRGRSATRRCSCCTPGRQPLDVERLRAELEKMGESVLVAGDGRAVKVHVHNDAAGPGHRARAVDGVADADHRREPRRPVRTRSARDGGRAERRRLVAQVGPADGAGSGAGGRGRAGRARAGHHEARPHVDLETYGAGDGSRARRSRRPERVRAMAPPGRDACRWPSWRSPPATGWPASSTRTAWPRSCTAARPTTRRRASCSTPSRR